jgi:hypothetical protein
VPDGHRLGDDRVPDQPPLPADRASCGALGDPGLADQPLFRAAVPVRLVPVPGGERGENRGVHRSELCLRTRQADQHLGVRRRAQRRPVGGGQVIQGGIQHVGRHPGAREGRCPHLDHLLA